MTILVPLIPARLPTTGRHSAGPAAPEPGALPRPSAAIKGKPKFTAAFVRIPRASRAAEDSLPPDVVQHVAK